MTSEATRGNDQFFIAAPKTIPIAYPQSEPEMQGGCIFFFRHELYSELLEPGKPWQNIAYGFVHRHRPIVRAKLPILTVRLYLHGHEPSERQESCDCDQESTER